MAGNAQGARPHQTGHLSGPSAGRTFRLALLQGWLEQEERGRQGYGMDDEEDEEYIERAERFESAYNHRFEARALPRCNSAHAELAWPLHDMPCTRWSRARPHCMSTFPMQLVPHLCGCVHGVSAAGACKTGVVPAWRSPPSACEVWCMRKATAAGKRSADFSRELPLVKPGPYLADTLI